MARFLLLVYVDPDLLGSLPEGEFDGMMRQCLGHADDLRREGRLLDARMLEDPPTARSVRVRQGRTSVTDGPFSEVKEVLGGFNLIEAAGGGTLRAQMPPKIPLGLDPVVLAAAPRLRWSQATLMAEGISNGGEFQPSFARVPATSSAPSASPCVDLLPALVGAPQPITVRQQISVGFPLLFNAASMAFATAAASWPSTSRTTFQP